MAQFAASTDSFQDFTYGAPANDAGAMALSVSVYADRGWLRDEIAEDAAAAGFRIAVREGLAELLEGASRPLGDVVLVDCPLVDAGVMAALSRLDVRAGHAGAQLVVSTSVEALDDVFACLDQSGAQILVAPSRAERVIALGGVLARMPSRRVRELSDEDRVMLLRLTQQVSQIAERIDRIGAPGAAATSTPAFRFEGAMAGDTLQAEVADKLVRNPKPALPDPRLVRRIIRQRQMRARFFDGDLFADPAWDMLLDLTAARAEHGRVSVTSLCIASGVPPTTALRWIGQMTEGGLLERVEDETDRRRAFITLTDKAADAMARYFAEMGALANRLV